MHFHAIVFSGGGVEQSVTEPRRSMFVPRCIYIPPENFYWLEWKKTIIGTSAAILGLLGWCALGEYFLP
jgi:hypothetical protein